MHYDYSNLQGENLQNGVTAFVGQVHKPLCHDKAPSLERGKSLPGSTHNQATVSTRQSLVR